MSADPIWSPSVARIENSQLHRFIERHVPDLTAYADVHRWSIEEPEAFWSAVTEFCELNLARAPSSIVEGFEKMPGARWFVGASLNYAENLLSGDSERSAIVFVSENGERRELTLGKLRARVAAVAASLRSLGIGRGDCVAGILPNTPECVIAALATASIGATWSSCSPDFGLDGLIDRLGQIEPKVLFGVDAYLYAGKKIECLPTLYAVADALRSVISVVVTHYAGDAGDIGSRPDTHQFASLLADESVPVYEHVPFDHPLFVLFSSGTTGPPKCIVHSVGGTLLQHLKEHRLHTDIRPGTHVFYYTTCGWMMWNWLLSSLASGATLILYDGSPLHPDPGVLWRLADQEGISVFGTSARYLSALERSGFEPSGSGEFRGLDSILSTGSPLAPASFDFVYRSIKSDVLLASISGGTDLISCFALGNPMLPVYRGEIQCRGLGMDVRIFDPNGQELKTGTGELVCTSPFPSMPVGFRNDTDGSAYRRAYFERYPGVWHHGDFAELTATGGIVMHGRSDATLNPGGVRIGTAEIYRIVDKIPEIADCVVIGQQWNDDTRIVLCIVPTGEAQLDSGMIDRIRGAIRTGASPHHVPAKILSVRDIPRTLNGKVSERAASDAIHGREVGNLKALANPDSLADFRNRGELES